MPTGKQVLSALQDANGYVALAVTIGEQVVPVGKWLVSEFKALSTGGETVSYPVLVQNDLTELNLVEQMAADDLNAVNAELAKLGKPPLVPSPTD